MRRSLLLSAVVLMSMSCFGQVFRFQQFCQTGAQNVVTQGLNSTTHVQRSYPSCTVAVYLTGTTTLATIYSDPLSTPLANPFTANTDGSFGFWAAPSANSSGCYDVTISGGNPGDQLSAPFTFAGVCLGVGGGGGGSVSCPLAVFGAVGAFTSTTGFSCDPNFKTDFQGNFSAISGTFLGPVNGFFSLKGGTVDPGTQTKYKLPVNTFRWLAAASGSSFYGRVPSTHCTPGQVWQVLSNSTDSNGDPIDNMSCLTPGAGVTFQTNSVNNGSQTLLNLIAGTNITLSNSGGNTTITAAGAAAPQASNPSAPVLTTNGSAGSTSYTYLVVGCEDGPTCAYHSAASATATIATGNATLSSSNSINLKTYADTLYGYRCYNIYRTASAGTPASVGLIANCAGKSFIDTGLTGDTTTAPSTNTTALDANGLLRPTNACNTIPLSPNDIDAVPCSPDATNDEFGHTFGALGDVNDGMWTWVNQNSATATLTNGMVSISGAPGSEQQQCLFQSAPGSTPYTYTTVGYNNVTIGGSSVINLAFRESATGKIVSIGSQIQNSSNSNKLLVGKWTNATTNSTFPVSGSTSSTTNPLYLRVQNTGANTVYSWSPDGVIYQTALSEAINAFFTSGPNQVGICLEAGSGTGK